MAIMRLLDRFRLRLRSLFRSRHADEELANEIRMHLEEEAGALMAQGMSPAAARAEARRSFGPVAAVEDACRDTRRVSFVQNLAQDLRYGLRSLLKQPLLILAATASIGVGVGANTLIFSLASELILAVPDARAPHELVNIRISQSSHVSYPNWREMDESGALAGFAGYNIEQAINWRAGDRTVTLVPLVVTANFFDLLGVPIARGRAFTASEAAAEKNPRVVVVSDTFWRQRLGGDPSAIGRSITLNGDPFTVLGVLPANLRAMPGLGLAPEIYIPLSTAVMVDLNNRFASAAQLVGRLRPGQSAEQGRAAVNTFVQSRPNPENDRRPFVSDFSPVTAGVLGVGGVATFFSVLLVVVALVLGIACANVAGLLLARGTVRRREIAVRLALGASRGRLVQQLLAESFWLALAGTAGGVLLMVTAMTAISRVPLPLPLPLELRAPLDLRLLGYAFVIVLLATLFSGLAPALQATGSSLNPALKQDQRMYLHRRLTLRGLLVMGQVTVSIVLLVASFLFLRNLARTQVMDPGFDTSRSMVAVISFVEHRYTAETRLTLLRDAIDSVEALPGIERASFAFGMPLTLRHGRTSGSDIWIESDGEKKFHGYWAENLVGPGYFETLGIPLRQGRDFTRNDDARGAPVVIINEAFVQRYFGARSPMGLRLMLPGPKVSLPYEVVGIVGNSKHRTLGEEQMAAIYFSYPQRPSGFRIAHVMARSRAGAESSSAALTAAMAKAIGALDPSAGVEVQTMRQTLAFAFLPSQVGAALLGSLGLIGVTLAAAGLFAMLSYTVTRRTREIGIRMALGATSPSVASLVARDAAILVAVGIAAGLGIAALVTQPLTLFLVAGLSPSDPLSFAGTALLFALVSAAATWVPVRRAMRVQPVVALREE
jgi:putative ABC transport system permease protein